ncbi:MAG: nucleotide exchange factor GrpE [Schleiferiaceae bacterium]|nr:nucleotide exchange factor GrpE [Schleiferiaceae bacterium]
MSKKKSKKEDIKMDDVNTTEVVDNPAEEGKKASENNEKEPVEVTDEDKIAALEKQLADQKDKNLRLFADFENLRRRTAKEKIEMFSTANKELMSALLPVLDDFGRAMKNLKELDAKKEVLEGVELIHSKFEKTLEGKGLKAMEDTTGKEFDVDVMEAITRIPAPSPEMGGKVIDEIERGYKLGDKILRYSKVVVGEKAE